MAKESLVFIFKNEHEETACDMSGGMYPGGRLIVLNEEYARDNGIYNGLKDVARKLARHTKTNRVELHGIAFNASKVKLGSAFADGILCDVEGNEIVVEDILEKDASA